MTGSGLIVGILHRYTSARDIMCSKQLIKILDPKLSPSSVLLSLVSLVSGWILKLKKLIFLVVFLGLGQTFLHYFLFS